MWEALGLPPSAFGFPEGDWHAVEGEGKAVNGVIPCSSFLGADEELVFSKEDGDGLDPCEVAFHVGISLADEVGIDVKVGVG